jgi:flagellar biosynthesis/type III secretory pathway M-ring protein FliF/YscJ
MTQSDNPDNSDETDDGPSFLPGPKPLAPIPRYESGSDQRLRDKLRGTSSVVSDVPVTDDNGGFSVAGIEGRIDRKKANVAAKLVETDPDKALRVIRNWLLEE